MAEKHNPLYSSEFIAWTKTVKTSKRAATALEMLLERGSITTADLNQAGYDHPPRVAGDLKDSGFVIKTEQTSINGRRMARYRCAVCGGQSIARMLQADHRIPFAIGGDPKPFDIDAFMPLCGSGNRAKSMSCETCPNWITRSTETCSTCYWHDPDNYSHIGTVEERRITLTTKDPKEISALDKLSEEAHRMNTSFTDFFIKRLID